MKNFFKNNKTYSLVLAAALVLLVFSGVQTSRATLTYVSNNYTAQVDMKDIGIAILENGKVAEGEILTGILNGAQYIDAGTEYDEVLTVQNTGTIDEFVRVIVRKYWSDASGKRYDIGVENINLSFGSGWIRDNENSTSEQTILYYPTKLASGEITSPFVEKVSVNKDLLKYVTTVQTSPTTWETTFDYNGVFFNLKVEADGVQTHNAEDAAKSAWGIDTEVEGDTMTIIQQGTIVAENGSANVNQQNVSVEG